MDPILKFLCKEANVKLPKLDHSGKLTLLDHLLTQRYPTTPIPAEINNAINTLLQDESRKKHYTSAKSLDTFTTSSGKKVSVWKGDITSLTDIDAIVNAANSQLLGCFTPGHKCIDNVIHAAAGPDLRAHIYNHILKPRNFIPQQTGSAEITPGFNLPAKYVLHTVGPVVRNGPPSEIDAVNLANCYRSCMRKLEEHGGGSIAFCCISTGVFGYPNDLACGVAVKSVLDFLDGSSISHVVFNTFLERDYELYLGHFERSEKE